MACWCAGACPHISESVKLLNARKVPAAEAILRRVLTSNPGCGEAHKALAYCLVETNHAYAAIAHIETAEKLLGPLPGILADKASVYRNAMELPPAIAAGRAAVAADPDNPKPWIQLASNLQADHDIDGMGEAIGEAVARLGEHPHLRLVRAIYAGELADHEKAVDLLNHGAELAPLELYERGRAYEKLGRYPEAWGDWMEAKRLQRAQGLAWDRARAEKIFAGFFDSCRKRRFAGVPIAGPVKGPQPIFITGLPRSGTTMIEAILAAHSLICGGDELMALPDVIEILPALLRARTPYPAAIGALRLADNLPMIEILRDLYLKRAYQKAGAGVAGKWWFTDKMPSNELHWPLLSKLFPWARIIHTQRHPLDVMVSNMSHNLVHGGFISCGLDSFAAHMVMVARLTEHYRKSLPGLQVKTVPYESLTADLPRYLPELLPIGCAVEPACLSFHESPWRSRTISHRQIKQKISTKSIGRYKPFIEFLKPILGELAPIMETQGYEL